MYRPRSIGKLILIGLVVVVTPLIGAVVTAVVRVDRLAEQSRAAVLETEAATQESRNLLERLIEMRRPFLQYQATADRDFYAIYVERRAEFVEAVDSLTMLRLTARGQEHLRDLIAKEQVLFDAFGDSPDRPSVTQPRVDAEIVWAELNDLARAVLAESSSLVERQANETTATADKLQRTLLMQAAAVIPGTMVLAAVFVVLITRPMQEIGRAIRRLGSQELSQTIRVHGPRDVEDLGKLLEWLRQRIVDLEHQKITFLRHISHELKTPLTTIREGSDLLAEGLARSDYEQAEIAGILRANSLHLQRLIEDLLRFSATQDVVQGLKLSDSVDLRLVVRSVISAQTLASEAKGISVVARYAPTYVRGDENKIRIVVDNLLNNAIKYTPSGGRVGISMRVDGECVVIDVEDTGPGVDDDDVEKIFEPFQQGKAQYQASVKGTGLGLSIAKEYVEAHDGYIKVVGSPGGAHFRVSLPIAGPVRLRSEQRAGVTGGLLVGV